MKKPTKVTREPSYDYHDVIEYLENKYKIDTRGYKRELDDVYRDFWHWIVDITDIHNGSYFNLYVRDLIEEESASWWVLEILNLIFEEFGEDEMRFWVSW